MEQNGHRLYEAQLVRACFMGHLLGLVGNGGGGGVGGSIVALWICGCISIITIVAAAIDVVQISAGHGEASSPEH